MTPLSLYDPGTKDTKHWHCRLGSPANCELSGLPFKAALGQILCEKNKPKKTSCQSCIILYHKEVLHAFTAVIWHHVSLFKPLSALTDTKMQNCQMQHEGWVATIHHLWSTSQQAITGKYWRCAHPHLVLWSAFLSGEGLHEQEDHLDKANNPI